MACFQKQNKKKRNKKKGSEYKHAAAALVFGPPRPSSQYHSLPLPIPFPLPIPIQPITIPFPVPSLSESASQYNPVQFSPLHGTPRYVRSSPYRIPIRSSPPPLPEMRLLAGSVSEVSDWSEGVCGGAGYCGQPNLPALKGRCVLLRLALALWRGQLYRLADAGCLRS